MMSRLTTALRAATAAALTASFAVAGAATASADPSTGSTADINTLAASLSKGYGLNNCKPQAITEKGEIAELQCGESPDSSGPASGQYGLFSSSGDAAATFANAVKGGTMTGCGGDMTQSPGTWSQNGQAGGKLACETSQNLAVVTWTTDSKNLVGQIVGRNGDVGTLYKWWQANG
ncbi:serine/threonine protein kinase [Mycobacterium paraense]